MNCRGDIVCRSRGTSFVLIALVCSIVQARDIPKRDTPANAATRSIHDEAVRILNGAQITEYRHRTQIDEKKGVYRCDCSGFVGYVLNRTVAKEDGKGPFHDGRRRPTAMEYEKFFAAAPAADEPNSRNARRGNFPSRSAQQATVPGPSRWQRVLQLNEARPGDVIAWRHEKPQPGNTGHVVIVDQAPVPDRGGLVRVVVIDSTTLPWQDDAGTKHGGGIGRRTMWFTVDKEGRPRGYVRGSRTAKPKVESISIGRAMPVEEKRASSRRAA